MSYFSKTPGQNFRNVRVTNNIDSLPFAELGEECKGTNDTTISLALETFAESHGLKHKTWLYPQISAKVAKWTLSRNESTHISAVQMLKDNCKKDPFNMGLYYFCMHNTRHLAKQYTSDNAPYCALVPLILAAHKKMNGIAYSDWDATELNYVVNPALYVAMTTIVPEYTREELLEFRTTGLTVKSGDKAGVVKSPVTTYSLNGLPWTVGERVGPGQLPQLVRMMVCQTWCAHPSNRNKYMILDPADWDGMPEPLITADPLVSAPTTTRSNSLWD